MSAIDVVDDPAPENDRTPGEPPAPGRRYRRALLLILLAASVLRVGYSFVIAADFPAGDGQRYSLVGAVIARGGGFADPFDGRPAGDHPPVTFLVEAVSPALIRTDATFRGLPVWLFGQRLTMAAVGVATVAVVAALGRRLGGDRTGLAAGALAAVNPNLWINDGLLMAEAPAALVTAIFLWAVYRAIDSSSIAGWGLVGAVGGVGALVRSESLLAVAVTVIPLLVWIHRDALTDALARLAACGVALALVCATWIVPNLIRFPEPTLFSTNDGLTLLGANCNETYQGQLMGLWTLRCLETVDGDHNGIDDWTDLQRDDPPETLGPEPSALSIEYRGAAVDHAGDNLDRLPAVAAVRAMRLWGVYRPSQMVLYNTGEARRPAVSWAAWVWHVASFPFVVLGLIMLRRRGRMIWPLVAQALAVTLVGAAIYGLVRFRIGWDVAATLALAVGLLSLPDLWSTWTARSSATPRRPGSTTVPTDR